MFVSYSLINEENCNRFVLNGVKEGTLINLFMIYCAES